MIEDYRSTYPLKVVLEDGQVINISEEDMKNRVLILEVGLDVNRLKKIFFDYKFVNGWPEETKIGQIGEGMRKKIDENWHMHIRFFNYHLNYTAIDAEVETGIGYVDHLSHPENWVSVLKEVFLIIKDHTTDIKLYHKKLRKHIKDVIEIGTIKLSKSAFQTKWSELALVGIITAVVGSLTYLGAKEIARSIEETLNGIGEWIENTHQDFIDIFSDSADEAINEIMDFLGLKKD